MYRCLCNISRFFGKQVCIVLLRDLSSVVWLSCPLLLWCGSPARCIGAMAASDPFRDLAVAFAGFLPEEQRDYWYFVLERYDNGFFDQALVAQTMTQMRAAVLRQQVEEEHEAAESEPGTASQAGKGASQAGKGAPPAVPTAWHNPPAELYYGDEWEEPWWMWEGGKGYWGYDPGWWKGFQAKGGGKGKKGGFNKGGGKGWQGPKGGGKGPKGEQGAKGGKDQAGKGGKGGKGGRGGKNREVSAVSLRDAESRMRRWMSTHPDFVFRPREAVPEDLEEAFNGLGETGPQLWKNLRHHMATEQGAAIAARVIQYMAEKSTWKADRMNTVEKERKQRRERDADSSRLSVATGYTGWSTATVRGRR